MAMNSNSCVPTLKVTTFTCSVFTALGAISLSLNLLLFCSPSKDLDHVTTHPFLYSEITIFPSIALINIVTLKHIYLRVYVLLIQLLTVSYFPMSQMRK